MAVNNPYAFRIDTALDGAVMRVSVFGEVDAATAPALAACLDEAATEGIGEVVVVCEGLEFIDSSGLTVLVAAHKRLLATGGRLVVEAPQAPVKRVFDICGLDRVLMIR